MISFITPAHNEERLLPRTLSAMHTAAGAAGVDYEIVVADDSSTDRTAAMALDHGARLIRVEYRQIAATRNAGAAAARGDVFVFVDADTVISESVVRSVTAALDRGAVGGGASVRYEGPMPVYAKLVCPVAVWFYLHVARLAAGCCMYCTRGAFEASGGFDEGLYAAEEIGFCRALKQQGRFEIVSAAVATSGRKFSRYSPWELLATPLRFLFRGRAAVRSRENLDIWYRDRETSRGCASDLAEP